MDGYDHTQGGGWHWLMAVPAVPLVAGGAVAGQLAPALTGLFLIVCGGLVAQMRVWDDGDALRVRFGPVPLLGTRVPYEQIERVETCRTKWWHGWGVHGWPGAWLVFNIWGFGAVALHLKEPRSPLRFRRYVIGTDEPEALAEFLRSRIGEVEDRGGGSMNDEL